MEVGYGGDENLGALLSIQFCEYFNHYVHGYENVASQQPCQVVQSPNRICQHVLDVNVTLASHTTRNLASK